MANTARWSYAHGGAYNSRSEVAEMIERSNPDSEHWQEMARRTQDKVSRLLGDDWRTLTEMIWPGTSIDDLSWRRIYEMSNAVLALAFHGERNLEVLSDAAISSKSYLNDNTK